MDAFTLQNVRLFKPNRKTGGHLALTETQIPQSMTSILPYT